MGSVLFIIHDVYQEDNHFPIGIGYLAAVLKRAGHDIEIYCQDLFHYTNFELANFLKNRKFDLIGLGFLDARFRETIIPLSKIINKFKKDAWFVLGGNGATPIPEYVLRETRADLVSMGESETILPNIAEAKLNYKNLENIKGIAYYQNDEIIINERDKPIHDLDSIPFPEWSLFPIEKYSKSLKYYRMDSNDKVLGIMSSRGCIGKCNFCYRIEKGLRLRNIKNVVREMQILNERYGINYFVFYDELFAYPKKRIFEFRDRLDEAGLKIKYTTSGVRVDLLDRETLECLKETGCQFLDFGIESMNQKVLKLMNKQTTIKQNIDAVEMCRELDIGVGLNFIWGNYGDSEATLLEDVAFINKYNSPDQVRTIRPVTPYPGSQLYYEAITKGLLSGPNDFFNRFKNSDLLTVNFTNIPEDKYYKLLFEANKQLILHYYSHFKRNKMQEAYRTINAYFDLYFKEKYDFRGVRHYN